MPILSLTCTEFEIPMKFGSVPAQISFALREATFVELEEHASNNSFTQLQRHIHLKFIQNLLCDDGAMKFATFCRL